MQLKIKLYFLPLFFIPLLWAGCNKDDDDMQEILPNELLTNGDLETGAASPSGWFNSAPCENNNLVWTEEAAFSPRKSLKISNSTNGSNCISFWGQTLNTDLPTGKSLTLRVRIKSQLEGQGVSIVIRGDDTPDIEGNAEQFATTQADSPIVGTFDWTEYSISLDTVEPTTQSLTVYLVFLPETTGEVYFDDVSLVFE